MFPAKQKASDKHSRRDKKKPSRQAATAGSPSTSAYNPVSGTFHSLESVVSDSGTPNQNGKVKSADETEDRLNLNGVSIEYDSVSNVSSCSGESEDQFGKEKQALTRLETPPGLDVGLDKREKIRCKNEKKHQRQKERRAQELRDKCCGYLMSRKLEILAQQLVSMGFSSDSATMALILNEGHVEQSVSSLLEGGDGQLKDLNTGGNLKINISDELAQMADIEGKYKFPRSEIERAVVSCEGDLEKAIALLHTRNNTSTSVPQDQNASPGPKDMSRHATEQPPLVSYASQTSTVDQVKDCVSPSAHQHRKEEKDANNINTSSQGSSVSAMERWPKEVLSSRSPNHISANRQNQSPLSDERGMRRGRRLPLSNEPALPQSLSSPVFSRSHPKSDSLQRKSKPETKSVHFISKQSTMSAEIPQSPNQNIAASVSMGVCLPPSPPLLSTSVWTSTFTSNVTEPYPNSTLGNTSMNGGSIAKQSQEKISTAGLDSNGHYHPLFSTQLDGGLAASWTTGSKKLASSDTPVSSTSSLVSSLHSTSLGLYTGWGAGFSGSHVDWSMGSIANCDYRNIDWSMAASPSRSADCSSIWRLSSSLASLKSFGDEKIGLNLVKEEHQSISGDLGLVNSNKVCNGWIGSTLKGHSQTGVQGKPLVETGNISTLPLHDWTSPFAGKDLFSLSHQAVSSPTL